MTGPTGVRMVVFGLYRYLFKWTLCLWIFNNLGVKSWEFFTSLYVERDLITRKRKMSIAMVRLFLKNELVDYKC